MPPLYAICDDQWNLIKATSSPMGLNASTGKTYSNAALASVEDLRENFVLVVNHGSKPDQEWKTVVGNPAVVIDGDPEQSETMTAALVYATQPISLEAAQVKLKNLAKSRKFSRMDAGVLINIDGTNYVAQTDSESRSLLMAIYFKALTGGLPDGQNWRMQDNSYPLLTSAQIVELGDAVNGMIAQCYDQQAAHDAAIDALPDLESCIAYDCTAGYPALPEIVTE